MLTTGIKFQAYQFKNEMIKLQNYQVNTTITPELLETYITRFWNEIYQQIENKENIYLMLLVKVQFTNPEAAMAGGYRTLGHLRKVNFSDKELFINYIQERMGLLTDAYTVLPIKLIEFSYIIVRGEILDDERALLKDLSSKSLQKHRFNNMDLPISMNPSDYGDIILSNKIDAGITRYTVTDNLRTYQIDVSEDGMTNKIRLLGASDLKWIDTKISDDLFMREIGKSTKYYLDGFEICKKQQLNAKPFSVKSKSSKLRTNFTTLDIETINKEGELTPYLVNIFNGKEHLTSYALNNGEDLNQSELFDSVIKNLISFVNKKSNSLLVYAHNLSGFDGIFIMKHLLNYGEVKPLLFNGKLINISLTIKEGSSITFKNGGTQLFKKDLVINFQDSFLMLPLSLRLLCKAFGVKLTKGYFPFDLTDINYTGQVPAIDLWSDIPANVYENILSEFINKDWSFKQESIKYCKQDCESLHQVLTKFNELIFNEFEVNMTDSLTLPALAMTIFKTHFIPKPVYGEDENGKVDKKVILNPQELIYQMVGEIDWEIRESYTGGAVDVFIPQNSDNSELFYYDVNSLYPTVMAQGDMPVGKPIRFEGDILKVEPDAFGFFYCKITSPAYLEHPILQRRIKTSQGLRTIAGLGSWEGYIFSEELKNSMKFGYKFEVLEGYQFNRGNIFKDYVNKMYNLRMSYPKGHPMNLIAKLLLNSLYGKFGMRQELTKVEIFDCSTESGKEIFKNTLISLGESIHDYVQIDDKYLIIRDTMAEFEWDEQEEMYHGSDINVGIASAVTSYARIYMSAFKNNRNYNLYYSDTDSIVINSELPETIVGDGLGQLKLEHNISKAVFLAPKVYGIVTDKGEEVIKVKGITKEVASTLHIEDLEALLVNDSSREFTQEKWYKKVLEGTISISDVIYTLKVTSNKREAIYQDGIFTATKPYNYNKLTEE